MTQEHPITPPPELVKQWCYEDRDEVATSPRWFHIVCTKAARWGADQQLDLDAEQINQAWQKGADQELKACCEWLLDHGYDLCSPKMRKARRPKPPSLKEEALAEMELLETEGTHACSLAVLRRALESLPD